MKRINVSVYKDKYCWRKDDLKKFPIVAKGFSLIKSISKTHNLHLYMCITNAINLSVGLT